MHNQYKKVIHEFASFSLFLFKERSIISITMSTQCKQCKYTEVYYINTVPQTKAATSTKDLETKSLETKLCQIIKALVFSWNPNLFDYISIGDLGIKGVGI